MTLLTSTRCARRPRGARAARRRAGRARRIAAVRAALGLPPAKRRVATLRRGRRRRWRSGCSGSQRRSPRSPARRARECDRPCRRCSSSTSRGRWPRPATATSPTRLDRAARRGDAAARIDPEVDGGDRHDHRPSAARSPAGRGRRGLRRRGAPSRRDREPAAARPRASARRRYGALDDDRPRATTSNAAATRRVVVLLTDGESNPFDTGAARRRASRADRSYRFVAVRFWAGDESVYDSDGEPGARLPARPAARAILDDARRRRSAGARSTTADLGAASRVPAKPRRTADRRRRGSAAPTPDVRAGAVRRRRGPRCSCSRLALPGRIASRSVGSSVS